MHANPSPGICRKRGKPRSRPKKTHNALRIRSFSIAPLHVRNYSPNYMHMMTTRGDIIADPAYDYHPSRRLDLQCPQTLKSDQLDDVPTLINIYYLINVYSTSDPNTNSFYVYIYMSGEGHAPSHALYHLLEQPL